MKQEGLKKSFVHAMQQKIFSGEYQIGQQLPPERELAQELGVSRSLVNTGILELANQGFIRIIPRQGSIVADYKRNGTLQVLSALMSCDSFRIDYPLFCNLVDLRVLVECECARLASAHATSDEIESLRVLAHCIKNASQLYQERVAPAGCGRTHDPLSLSTDAIFRQRGLRHDL